MSVDGCVFCRIVAGTKPASVVYEDEMTLAFMDLRQPSPSTGHLLVIPKLHVEMIYDLEPDLTARLFDTVVAVARAVRRGLQPDGLTIWQSNSAPWQEVFHVHVHLLPRYRGDGLVRVYQEVPGSAERDLLEHLAATIRSGLGEG